MSLIQYISRIQFDFSARKELASELALLNVTRPLVVSDAGIERSGVLEMALEHLPDAKDLPRFTAVRPNPTLGCVEAALALYREFGCDGVIAVGGGSVIDCAKATALLATHEAPIHRYLAARGGAQHIGEIAPVVAMPTTAGTGAEIGRGMGITLPDAEGVFLSIRLIPKVAICDPELTLGLPPAMTTGSGADALSHALEAYLSPAINPPADAIALDAIDRIMTHLPRAVRNGADRDARWNVMMGATEAAMTMWKGLGPAHALSVPLEAAGCHHGTLVGMLLPHSVRLVARAIAPDRLERLARAMSCEPAAIPAALEAFNREIGLPRKLSDIGVKPDMIASASEAAAASIFNMTSAVKGTAQDYRAILEEMI